MRNTVKNKMFEMVLFKYTYNNKLVVNKNKVQKR